jgi:hypothetical protein
MAKKYRTKRDLQWAEAKRKCRLSAETLCMAKELGLNPRSLIKNIPNQAEPWKAPVHVWIRDMYDKHRVKAARRRAAKGREGTNKQEDPADGSRAAGAKQQRDRMPNDHDVRVGNQGLIPLPGGRPDDDVGDAEFQVLDEGGWLNDDPPSNKQVAEQNDSMLRRQESFRIAADQVARTLSDVPAVQKVVLFGSVAVPLGKEVPRFREFRKAGIAVWHECKDVDLAVWVDDLDSLKRLQRARSRALNDLLRDMHIGVAHHQVEIFIFEPGTDQYLGRLCCFSRCPTGKPECDVAACGATLFLRQHEGFTFRSEALAAERVVVLFDRNQECSDEFDRNEIPF